MKERPINLAAWEVRAFLDGRKTRITRPIDPRADWEMSERDDGTPWPYFRAYVGGDPEPMEVPCPFGVPGDRLWCRECWCDIRGGGFGEKAAYRANALRADGREDSDAVRARMDYGYRWASSSTMPRWASRIWQDVVGVRVVRLQDIDCSGIRAEGFEVEGTMPACQTVYAEEMTRMFSAAWDARYGKRFPWSSNPWVWVGDVRRTEA